MKERLAAFANEHLDFAFKLLCLFLPLLRFNAFNPGVFRITLEDYRLEG